MATDLFRNLTHRFYDVLWKVEDSPGHGANGLRDDGLVVIDVVVVLPVQQLILIQRQVWETIYLEGYFCL